MEGRSIGMDVHRDFCEIAICEPDGCVRRGPRVATGRGALREFAEQLGPQDRVAMEATGNALQIARIIGPHVKQVIVANTRRLAVIAQAKNKTDRREARTIAQLLHAGLLEDCWQPDETIRALRRRTARRAKLVRHRARFKNEILAVLHRNLKPRPPMTDVFGVAGREWLAALALPVDERDTVNAGLRQIDFLTEEITTLERDLARYTLDSDEAKRLMTVPGVGMITATVFLAAVGDIARFPDTRRLVGYLGLDPRVRQSGASPAHTGRISKEGASEVRHVLVEAALTAVRTPGPLKAFYERTRGRRGQQIAIVATARKMATLFWHLLTTQRDYAYTMPTATDKKLRGVELKAGAAPRKPGGPRQPLNREQRRQAERATAEHAQAAYERTVTDWHHQQRQRANAMTGT
ncbi:MAG: IS110 family transposase [Solirubrobacteraceae bacterium MAG38_C4-C5]|nr:IS110 family transposase [Candidatus Siliceabacter maunaloa]